MSISSKLTQLANGIQSVKTSLASHLQSKGVTVPANSKLKDFASLIDQIQMQGSDNSDTSSSVNSFLGLAKITTYTAPKKSFTAITQIVVSGASNGDYNDFSSYNGTYTVTNQTSNKKGLERVYKHSSSDLTIHSGTVYDSNWNETTGWILGSLSFADTQPASGTWSNSDFGQTQTLTLTKTNTTYPAVSQLIQGKMVTSINNTGDTIQLTLDQQTTTFPQKQNSIQQGCVYCILNGDIVSTKYSDSLNVGNNGLIFLISQGQVKIGKATLNNTQNAPANNNGLIKLQSDNYIVTNISTSTCKNDFTISARVKLFSNKRIALFASSYRDCEIGIDTNGGTWNMWAGYNNDSSSWNILQADSSYSSTLNSQYGRGSIAVSVGQYQTITLIREDNVWSLYVDGQLSVRKQRYGMQIGTHDESKIRIGKWGGNNNDLNVDNMFIKYFKIYNTALSEQQITQQSSSQSGQSQSSADMLSGYYFEFPDDDMYGQSYTGNYIQTDTTFNGKSVYKKGNYYMFYMYNDYQDNYFWVITSGNSDITENHSYSYYVDGVGDVFGPKSDPTVGAPNSANWGNGTCTSL